MSLFVIKALKEAVHILRSTLSCRNTTEMSQQDLPEPSSSEELRGDLRTSCYRHQDWVSELLGCTTYTCYMMWTHLHKCAYVCVWVCSSKSFVYYIYLIKLMPFYHSNFRSYVFQISRVNLLPFDPRQGRGMGCHSTYRKAIVKPRCHTWTHKFICLPDTHQEQVPSTNERHSLWSAGLGKKKIVFQLDGDCIKRVLMETFPLLKIQKIQQ